MSNLAPLRAHRQFQCRVTRATRRETGAEILNSKTEVSGNPRHLCFYIYAASSHVKPCSHAGASAVSMPCYSHRAPQNRRWNPKKQNRGKRQSPLPLFFTYTKLHPMSKLAPMRAHRQFQCRVTRGARGETGAGILNSKTEVSGNPRYLCFYIYAASSHVKPCSHAGASAV